jgi:hypothetical protein
MAGRFSRRLLLAAPFALAACGGGTTTTEKVQPATTPLPVPPTANVEGTVSAAVSATVAALRPTLAAAVPTSPPATAIPKPAATPVPKAAAVRVESTETIYFKNSIGGTVVQGIVQNNGDGDAGSVQVAVSLLDDAGKTVGAGDDTPRPSILRPGQKGVWSASISDVPAFKEAKVQVQAKPVDSLARVFAYTDFKTQDVTIGPATRGGWQKVSGQIVNSGEKAASLILVSIAIYDEAGKLYFVDLTSSKLNELAPGGSSPFEFSFLTNRPAKPIEKYDLFVQGVPKG